MLSSSIVPWHETFLTQLTNRKQRDTADKCPVTTTQLSSVSIHTMTHMATVTLPKLEFAGRAAGASSTAVTESCPHDLRGSAVKYMATLRSLQDPKNSSSFILFNPTRNPVVDITSLQ
jgi:hypothetical protein